jgi:hypothetical protein
VPVAVAVMRVARVAVFHELKTTPNCRIG